MPLGDLRVIDLSTVIAGPNCARYLADFGADVIKVERPGGDSLRNMAWHDDRDGEGLWWKLINRNKRTVVADLKDPVDLELVLRLVDDAHVLVENFRPGALERLGSRSRRPPRPQPGPRRHPGVGLRPGRAVRPAPRVRHDRRGDVRVRRRSAASPTGSRCSRRSP